MKFQFLGIPGNTLEFIYFFTKRRGIPRCAWCNLHSIDPPHADAMISLPVAEHKMVSHVMHSPQLLGMRKSPQIFEWIAIDW